MQKRHWKIFVLSDQKKKKINKLGIEGMYFNTITAIEGKMTSPQLILYSK
jgi:hypothetical protein